MRRIAVDPPDLRADVHVAAGDADPAGSLHDLAAEGTRGLVADEQHR